MGWYGGFGWASWLVMAFMMVGFWALLIVGGLAVARSVRRDDHSSAGRADARQLLDERFARGEIDEDDYTKRRELLRTGH